MTLCRTSFSRSLIAFGFTLAMFCFVALHTVSAQGQGRGKGGGGGNGGGGGREPGWIEEFNDPDIESGRWGIEHTGSSDSQFGVPGAELASKTFDEANVEVLRSTGVLSLQLSITSDSFGLRSSGGLVYTRNKYGFGTYEWCARMSSTSETPTGKGVPLSGGVSAGFIYVNNSETEIDFEQAYADDGFGSSRLWLYMANWRNLKPWYTALPADPYLDDPNRPPPYAGFKLYRFVWARNYIDFYVDGELLATHTTNVPKAAAHVIMNHWGTNSPWFGGEAVDGVRYFYVDWVRHSPPGAAVPSPEITCPGSSAP